MTDTVKDAARIAELVSESLNGIGLLAQPDQYDTWRKKHGDEQLKTHLTDLLDELLRELRVMKQAGVSDGGPILQLEPLFRDLHAELKGWDDPKAAVPERIVKQAQRCLEPLTPA